LLVSQEGVSNAAHESEEEWARQQVRRLTAELKSERSARGLLEDRLMVLENEMQRDQREWQRTLKVGAALSSPSSLLQHTTAAADGAGIAGGSIGGPLASNAATKTKNGVGGGETTSGGAAAVLPANSAISKHIDGLFPSGDWP
jgi:hypothetical protein